ncbi:MAG: thioredoxin family protein [Planctomycetes bacterium]|nr:thioredoxin family protein [Planctomycetota bacterium]
MWIALAVAITLPQDPAPRATSLAVELAPAPTASKAAPRWSPKGAKVALHGEGDVLSGGFALGPVGSPGVAVRLAKSAGAERYDTLTIDLDRDGVLADDEALATVPKEQRGKWWSSFTATVQVPVPAEGDAAAATRPYAMNLWFVEDPLEPDAPPTLRWSRRGFQLGEVAIGGEPAFVQISEREMDGVFDQRDAWALARSEAELATAPPRSLEQHCWLDGVAWRAIAIDPHGRRLRFESFDPGITEAEEKAKADVYRPDREAARAKSPLAFGKDLAAALATAKQGGKRVFVDFETTWCGPCKLMDQWVYTAADVVAAADAVVAVQLDGDEQRELAKRYDVGGYPTMLLLDADGKELRRAVGYRSVKAMVEFLGR